MEKWEYDNIKKISEIQHLNKAVYYNSGQYGNQMLKKRKQKKFLIKPMQTKKIPKIYIPQDVKVIYLMEYYKVRNKEIYNELNSNAMNNDLKHFNYTRTNSSKIDSMLYAYNKSKNERRRNNMNKVENKQNKKEIVTKKEEVKQFKDSVNVPQKKLSELDKAAIEFERALKERREYEKELKEKGAREVKARKNLGTER